MAYMFYDSSNCRLADVKLWPMPCDGCYPVVQTSWLAMLKISEKRYNSANFTVFSRYVSDA